MGSPIFYSKNIKPTRCITFFNGSKPIFQLKIEVEQPRKLPKRVEHPPHPRPPLEESEVKVQSIEAVNEMSVKMLRRTSGFRFVLSSISGSKESREKKKKRERARDKKVSFFGAMTLVLLNKTYPTDNKTIENKKTYKP